MPRPLARCLARPGRGRRSLLLTLRWYVQADVRGRGDAGTPPALRRGSPPTAASASAAVRPRPACSGTGDLPCDLSLGFVASRKWVGTAVRVVTVTG